MTWSETLLRDVRDAARITRQRPGLCGTAVLTLALGIGVNVAALTTAYGILGRPLPYAAIDRIVVVNLLFPDGGDLGFSPRDVERWLPRLTSADAAAAYYARDVTIRTGSRSTVVRAAFVTEGFFDVLGVAPQSGRVRALSPEPELSIAQNRVHDVLSEDAMSAVGSPVSVGVGTRRVAAVLPSEFAFPNEQVGVWLPYHVKPFEEGYSKIVARLRPGVTPAQFRAEVDRVAHEMNADTHNRVSVVPLEESVVGRMRGILTAVVAGALLVLAVACANVATLVIGRDVARRREFATRLALGARRSDLVRGVLAETLLLALLGAIVGLLLGHIALEWFTTVAAAEVPRLVSVRMNAPVALTIVGLIAAATLLSGFVPAWHAARGEFTGFLKPTSASDPGMWAVRQVLMVAQIASCCVLLVGAGLLVRTVIVLLQEDAGFDGRHALAAKVVLSDKVLADSERTPFVRELLERTRMLPGVLAAGLGSNLPPRVPAVEMSIAVEHQGRRETRLLKVGAATPGFLPALGARFVAGRDFAQSDANASVVVLSQSIARFYFPNRDPIGQPFATLPPMFGLRGAPRVIGVVADIKYNGLDAPVGSALYLPWNQRPFGTGYLIARTASDPRALVADIRRTLAALDPSVPVPELAPLDDVVKGAIAGRRVRALPAAAFALLALAVASIGVLATLSTFVAERRRDLAIRSALGASRERLMWTVGRQGLLLTLTGIAIGLAGSAAAARGLTSLLYGVRPYDPATFAGTAALIGTTSLLMIAIGSLRALRIDPITLLRHD